MFEKILIANRGEIACRIIRTCRRLGIGTVAVYSQADEQARHVREADEAVCIGPAKASESYLNVAAIIQAATQTGVQAIHPGYGFLSERAELIDACVQAGIRFIGPSRQAIASMGSKIESKRIARAAQVPCVPGYDGDDQREERLTQEALVIGFPLLIKASAGGGGKGMRRVDAAHDFSAQLSLAKAEAMAAFGDDRVLLERYIQRPRHVEVQLLGDRHGGLVHLFERECSVQRNYQKLIEEAPANHLDAGVKARLFEAALLLGRAIAYDSAGTVEFVLDADRQDEPYFLEMNTRLQVEHPVTELTTGIDLVEWQIRVAAGERLGFEQSDLSQHGWAIEARVNAESAHESFAPSFGPVLGYEVPQLEGVRIDSGVDGHSDITPHYDSLLVKVIGHGASREVARTRLMCGLRGLRIEGLQTTQAMLLDMLAAPAFREVLTTQFLQMLWPQGWQRDASWLRLLQMVACAAWVRQSLPPGDQPMHTLVGWRLHRAADTAEANGVMVQAYPLLVREAGESASSLCRVQMSCASAHCMIDTQIAVLTDLGAGQWQAPGHDFHCVVQANEVRVWSQGSYVQFCVDPQVKASSATNLASASGDCVTTDLPGVLCELLVAQGQTVKAGERVAVIEAMKLFHTLHAPRDGVVKALPQKVGSTLPKGAVLVELDP